MTEPGRDAFRIIRWARETAIEHDLPPTEAHVLLVLATYADCETGEAHPGVDRIAAEVRRCRRVTIAALVALEGCGLIKSRRRGPSKPATRRLTIPWADVQSTAPQDPPDVQSTAPHDVRPAAPDDVQPTAPRTTSGDSQERPPVAPRGRRQRDWWQYRDDIAAFAASLGLDDRRDPTTIERALKEAATRYGGPPSTPELVEHLRQHYPSVAARLTPLRVVA